MGVLSGRIPPLVDPLRLVTIIIIFFPICLKKTFLSLKLKKIK